MKIPNTSPDFFPNNSEITRRNFMKKSLLTAGTVTILGRGTGLAAGSGSTFYKIKCMTWPSEPTNKQENYASNDLYITRITLSGASQDQKASTFDINIDSTGIHKERPFGLENYFMVGAVQEKLKFKLTLNGGILIVTQTEGDGDATNGSLALAVTVSEQLTATVYFVEKTGFAITKGKIGYNPAQGLTAELEFSENTVVRGSAGIGCSFVVVRVNANGIEI